MAKTTEQGVTFAMAQQLLECAAQQLAATPAGTPPRVLVATGSEIAWDDCECGQLSVHMLRAYPSDDFPIIKQVAPFTVCEATWTVVEYVVTILRCVPASQDDGTPPPAAAVTAAAEQDHLDRWAVRRGVVCCFKAMDEADPRRAKAPRLLQEQLAVGEDGMCAGSELHLFVGFLNCVDC